MSFAIRIGSAEWMPIGDKPTPEGWVRVEEEPPRQDGVWDEKLQKLRVKTPDELSLDQQAVAVDLKRAAIKAQVVDAIVDSILAGKIPSDPVMADVAAKVAAADVAIVADPVVVLKP